MRMMKLSRSPSISLAVRAVVIVTATAMTGCSGATAPSTTTPHTQSPNSSAPLLTPTITPQPSPTPRPPILIDAIYPNDESPVEQLVILRGQDHLFDPSSHVSGGIGNLTFAWDFDGDPSTAESILMDPEPVRLEPGEYYPSLRVADEAGQEVFSELPRVVKIGPASEPDWNFGVVAHVNPSQGLYSNEIDIVHTLNMIADAGIEAVRFDFSWAEMEPERKGRYNWGEYDRTIELVRERGLRILALVGYSPRWASSNRGIEQFWAAPPISPDDFGEFVIELASRYDDDVDYWQIWNEPNISSFLYGTDPEVYFELLREAYLAIKYVNPEDTVVIGPMANGPSITGLPGMVPWEFLETVYTLGGVDYSDAAASNPYTDPFAGLQALLRKVIRMRSVMDDNGAEDQLLWITEIGYPTGMPPWSEQLMSRWLVTWFDAIRNIERTGPIVWYNFRDKGTDPNNGEHHFGLVDRSFNPKLTYFTYMDYIEQNPAD